MEGEETRSWRPIYRRALPILLDRLFDELDLSMSEAAKRSGRGSWSRYVRGEYVAQSPVVLAEGLGISVLDVERAWVVTCAELLGLGYVDVGRDRRTETEVGERLVYWHVVQPVVRDLQERLGRSQAECARRAGLSRAAWNDYLRGRKTPKGNLPKIARGLSLEIEELERNIVLRCLEEVGLASSWRLLTPAPCWVLGGVVLDDGRLLVAETLSARLWEYDLEGTGREMGAVAPGVSAVKWVVRSPQGALWLYGEETFVEIREDLVPIRSYGVWGRRDDEGRLLEALIQWTFEDDETVVGIVRSGESLLLARFWLNSDAAAGFETLEVLERASRMSRMQLQFWREGLPKLSAARDEIYLMTVQEETTEVLRVRSGEVVASYPGGTAVMEATRQAVGDGFVGLTARGLVTVEDEVWVWRRRDREYWFEGLDGELRCGRHKTNALRVVPVVGRRIAGVLELLGEEASATGSTGLRLQSWKPDKPGRLDACKIVRENHEEEIQDET